MNTSDHALVTRLIGNINELKHSLTCGSTLSHLLWKNIGCITMLFDVMEDYTNRLQLRASPNIGDVEQSIRQIQNDGDNVPYMVVRTAILRLDTLLRIAQAISDLIEKDAKRDE